jgi:hypothetical protein
MITTETVRKALKNIGMTEEEYTKQIIVMNQNIEQATKELRQEHGSQRLQREEERNERRVAQGYLE